MPNINVLTWNSRGESAPKAAFLQDLILNVLAATPPDVIVIQEALAAAGGAIFNTLAGLGGVAGGGNYAMNAPQFAGIGAEGYILKVSNAVTLGAGAFTVLDLAADPGAVAAVGAFAPVNRPAATAELQGMRDPARAPINFAGQLLNVMTWHAPLGPGLAFLPGISAGVNYAAYYFLQSSNYYTGTLRVPGAGNLSLVAGDLNATSNDLGTPTQAGPAIPNLFPGWVGVSNNLDHILAFRNVGGVGAVNFPNDGHYPAVGLSDHPVLFSTVHWP